MTQKLNVFWFRRDLRLKDNHGLFRALSAGLPVLPVFIFDKNILDRLENKKDHRLSFIHHSLELLDIEIQKYGSRLHVHYGDPLEIYNKLLKKWNIESVFTNHDYEPYAVARDSSVEKFLKEKGISFLTFKDQVVFEKDEVQKDDGTFYSVYTPYMKRWKELLKIKGLFRYESEKKLNFLYKCQKSMILSLEDIGFQQAHIDFPKKTISKDVFISYGKKRDFPFLDSTSHLGVHLRFGTVSPRALVEKALELKAEIWMNELIWREFFMQILWHNPLVVQSPFKEKYKNIPWRKSPEDFLSWCEGKTGYPLVDAGMRELNATGHMHNRVRMITASFLVKHLLLDWRLGEAYFAKMLFDFDLSANNGNWQWVVGCGCDAAPYFRIFNPYSQQEKFDKDFKYISKWVPEYKSMSYPKPIIDHVVARKRTLDVFKKALESKN